MSANPQRSVITGTGKPRIIKEMITALFTSGTGTTYPTGSAVDSGGVSAIILPGMRIRAKQITNVGGLDYEILAYAKVLSISLPNTVYIDEWIGGTPTAGQRFTVDGWIADLDRTLEDGLKETFTPLTLVHRLFRNRKATRDFGWAYEATLDYDRRVSPDMMYALRDVMNQSIDGSDETLILIPRKDKPGIAYKVWIRDPHDIVLHESGTVYKGVKYVFEGKEPISSPPHYRWGGYGMGYGQNYGDQL